MSLSAPIPAGTVLEARYEVLRLLGQGGFGRTYLVQDQHRFNEYCVLKEFAPQVTQLEVRQKAEELFQREAGTLYQLQHPQIPEFRALSAVQFNGETVLFLVEQFIDGDNYGQWVEQGHRLTPAQGLRLLRDLLPVLTYIHSKGVIHRDIAPDNIMCDRASGKPILIDFGSVHQVTQTALKLVSDRPIVPTQIHKPGYTPMEQIKGDIFPNTDLYALAVSVLVLMTGQAPSQLFDHMEQTWDWSKHVQMDQRFANILHRMLARHTADRYSAAADVLQALASIDLPLAENAIPATAIISPAVAPRNIPTTAPPDAPPQNLSVRGTPATSNPSAPTVSSMKTIAVAPAWQAPPSRTQPARPVQKLAPRPAPAAPVGYSAHTQALAQQQATDLGQPIEEYQDDYRDELARSEAGSLGWRVLTGTILLPFRLLGGLLKVLWGGIKLVDMMFTWLFRLIMIAVVLGLFAVGSMFGKSGLASMFQWPELKLPDIVVQMPQLQLPTLPSLPSLPNLPGSAGSEGCRDLQARVERSGLTYAQFNSQVNQQFYDRFPNLRGRALTDRPEDEPLRQAWCGIAGEVLKRNGQ